MHSIFWFLLWPASSWVLSAFWLREQTLFASTPFRLLLMGTAAGMWELIPQLIVVALIAMTTTVLIYSFSVVCRADPDERLKYIVAEPLAGLIAFSSGVSLVYPALLRQPLLVALHDLSVLAGTIILLGVALITGLLAGGLADNGATFICQVAATMVLIGCGWALAARPSPEAEPGADGIYLICIDSVSIPQGLEHLQKAVESNDGRWYRGAVAPGLLTNSTWTSILKNEPVTETGVFMIFQQADWSDNATLIRAASERGFRTISWFTGQFTVYVGSEAGFDTDRSGPKGWLQTPTAAVKDVSVLLPVMLRALPRVPAAKTPRNQSGTYAYDLDQDLAEIASLGSEYDEPVFVAAHLDYLHAPTYPGFSELEAEQRRAIRAAPIRSLIDQSLDWQFPGVDEEPLELQEWKLRNIERAMADMLERSNLVDPAKNNRVIIFSDHGDRTGIDNDNFAQPRYFNVPLATFNTPILSIRRPISLLEIGYLSGLAPRVPDRPAVVAYTNVSDEQEWRLFERTAELESDGTVSLDRDLLITLGNRLRCFEPGVKSEYWRCPVPPSLIEE